MEVCFNTVVQGNCIKVMKTFPSDYIDCIVTDPPYGISFMGKDWDKVLPPKEAFDEMYRVMKAGALAFVMSSPRQDVLWRMLQMLDSCGFKQKQSFISWVYASGFPKAYDISKGIDAKLGLEREVVSKTKSGGYAHVMKTNKEQGFRPEDYYSDKGNQFTSNEAKSELAKKWNGWKSQTGLKPALECILMVTKPFSEKTIVEQVLKTGTGAINVDACRIPTSENLNGDAYGNNSEGREEGVWKEHSGFKEGNAGIFQQPKGRFPANLLVSDNALDDGTITKRGVSKKFHEGYEGESNTNFIRGVSSPENQHGDSGGFSRYFDLDKWAKHHGFLRVPKASKSERNEGLTEVFKEKIVECLHGNADGTFNKRIGNKPSVSKNYHPTVKPVRLMAYLIELGCQPNGIVLDPFAGSGSTGIACLKLGRKFVGIEIDSGYCEIANARMKQGMMI